MKRDAGVFGGPVADDAEVFVDPVDSTRDGAAFDRQFGAGRVLGRLKFGVVEVDVVEELVESLVVEQLRVDLALIEALVILVLGRGRERWNHSSSGLRRGRRRRAL